MNTTQISYVFLCAMASIACASLLTDVQRTAQAEEQSLAASWDVYAFPAADQTSDQQSKDEAECYQWAVGNSGVDPAEVQKKAAAAQQQAAQAQQQAAQPPRGAGVRGAARGAAAGAVIGEIADDDAGEGAAIGAAAGAVRGRRQARAAQEQAQQQSQAAAQQSAQAGAAEIDHFKKAFGACLEGKKYTVKY